MLCERIGRKGAWIIIGIVTLWRLIDVIQRITSYHVVNTLIPQPRLQLHGLRKKIHESQWIQLFPNLKKMVEVVTDGDRKAITNPKHTSIKLLNSDDLQFGGALKAMITSYNEAGDRKTHGGDFFAIMLRPPGSKTDGVTCEIADHMNGSYSVSCILPWEGVASLEANLIHSSETIYQLMKTYSSEKEHLIFTNTTMLNTKNKTEFTACSVGFPDKRPDEICDYSNPTHGEKRTCLRTPSGECPDVILYQQKVVEGRQPEAFGCNINVAISGSGLRFIIRRSKSGSLQQRRYFTENLSLDPMTPSGWLVDGKWTSVKTRHTFNLGRKTIEKCFTNKRLHFFGDSTARNIYRYPIKILDITDFGLDNSVAWSRGRDAVSDRLNFTIQYRAHGPPLQNPGPEDSRPYISDSLDAIREGGNGTIVMFTIGFHFHYFDPDVYLRRVKIIKNASLSLLRRLPGAKIIIKGLHYHEDKHCRRSPWLTYNFEAIIRHEFYDVKDVIFVENWDFTLLHHNVNIHPPQDILEGTIAMLMLQIC